MNEPMIAARELGKVIDGRQILGGISANVEPGHVVGVLGKNGAGKTTLLEILLGFSPASSGNARICGHDSFSLPAAVKSRIGYVPQHDELVAMLTGAQQLALTASLYDAWDGALIENLAREWEVPLDRRISRLSGGERQKLSILLALGHRPQLLVLDEPLSSLDPIARRSFLRQLLDMTADQTRAVVFSSHIVSDLERVANRIWMIREGGMAWQGDLDDLKESVVRLHLRARRKLPMPLQVPHALFEQIEGNTATVSVSHWQPDGADALAARFDADVEIETLDLEDIFLELNR